MRQTGDAARLGVSFTAILAARVLSTAIQAFMLVLLAKQMQSRDFGMFSSILAVITLGIGLCDAGLQSYSIRERASDAAEAQATSARTYRASSVITGIVALAVAVIACSLRIGPGAGLAILGICVVVWLERQMNARLALAIASGLARSNVYVIAIARGTSLVVYLLLPDIASVEPLGRYLISILVGTSGALAISVLEARVPKSSWAPSRGDLRASLPFWTAGIWTQARTMDVPIVSVIAGAGAAGSYALPVKAGQPVKLLPAVFSSLGQPAAVRHDRRVLLLLDRGVAASTAVGFLLWVGVILAGKSTMTSVVGDSYAHAFVPLVLVLAGFIANVPGVYLSGVLVGAGFESFVSRWDLYVTIAYFIVLIPAAFLWSATGAACAFLLSNILQAMGVYWQRRRWNELLEAQ